jgi:hypothetical protein
VAGNGRVERHSKDSTAAACIMMHELGIDPTFAATPALA